MKSVPEIPAGTHPPRPSAPVRRSWRERCDVWCRRLATAAAVVLGVSVVPVAVMTSTLPDLEEIRATGDATKITRLYDSSDRLLLSVEKEERTPVPLSSISPHLVNAVIAVEDARFYRHMGIDMLRMASALATNIREREFAEGASTITQQLAREMFLDHRKTLWRKAREIILAFRIEHEFEKDKILELYLNEVYFGHGYYGIEAAARGYFGKPAKALTLPEAALLAGVIRAPSRYSPRTHLDRATSRRAVVLERMVDAGFIDHATAERDAKAPVNVTRAAQAAPFARYFESYVVRELVERLGEEAVYEGGLRVYSTIDPDLQRAAEAALTEGLKRIEAQRRYPHPRRHQAATAPPQGGSTPYLQGAIVAMTPDGQIAALVGGRDFNDSAYDRATQAKRQPGSAFKPFIYATALESGLTPASLLTGLTPALDDTGSTVSASAWWPKEAHESTIDEMTLRTALKTSSNRAAAMVLERVGLGRTIMYAKQFGFNPPPYPSMVLGTGEVTVLRLTAAYAAFVNGGHVPVPTAIRRVEDRWGNVVLQDMPSQTPAVSAATAFLTAEMLKDVVNAGSGYRVRRAGFTRPAGGKTGTTDDFKDAWFAGFTPDLVATVWVGFDEPRTIVREGFGGDLAAPIWGEFMKRGQTSRGGGWLEPPPGLVTAKICRLTGLLAGPNCDAVATYDSSGYPQSRSYVATEYFRAGTAPTEYCTTHAMLEPSVPDDFFFDRSTTMEDPLPSSPAVSSPLPAPIPPATLPTGRSAPPTLPTAELEPPPPAAPKTLPPPVNRGPAVPQPFPRVELPPPAPAAPEPLPPPPPAEPTPQ